ncbi:hypothetical protein OCU04_007220 [Sclerotinia nivalis]|uniref:Carrier domain-containing protein n=1 Tax=Sclerotinia nivalis TaxID=352851 RepID=A0A9X0ALD1_9HELO|nr:hypothetical protein OCU04_007220 [Sclerotinia nivalis]
MISQDDHINEKASLIEQGIDSLMAVEVRTWFLKELDVDIPVLKILGGSSIEDPLAEAMERVPASVVDFDKFILKCKPDTTETPKVAPRPRPESKIRESLAETPSFGSQSSPTNPHTTPATQAHTPLTEIGNSMNNIPKTNDQIEVVSASTKAQTISGKGYSCEISYGQARFWFLNDYLADKKSFNMTVMFKLTGMIQVNCLEAAVQTIAQRHEALRTRYFWSGNGDQRTPARHII